MPGPLTILFAPSGAGKTPLVADRWPGPVVDQDAVRDELGLSGYGTSAAPEVCAEVLRRVDAALGRGEDVLHDWSNTRDEMRRPLLALARQHGVKAHVIALDRSPVQIARHTAACGNVFRPDLVWHSCQHFRASLPALYAEGWDRIEHYLDLLA